VFLFWLRQEARGLKRTPPHVCKRLLFFMGNAIAGPVALGNSPFCRRVSLRGGFLIPKNGGREILHHTIFSVEEESAR
jgi:hypothetical protein